MVKIIKQGAYYQNGKLEKESQAFMTSDKKEKAIKNTLSYAILKAHGGKEGGIMFDSLLSEIAFPEYDFGIVNGVVSLGLDKFTVPYTLVAGNADFAKASDAFATAKKFGGNFVPANVAGGSFYLAESGAKKGDMILTSFEVTAGAVGAMCVSGSDYGFMSQFLRNPYPIENKEIIGVYVRGKLRRGVGAIDAGLSFLKAFEDIDATDKIFEFFGAGVQNLSMESRIVIDSLVRETGCFATVWETEESAPQQPAFYDGGATLDLTRTEPMISVYGEIYTLEELMNTELPDDIECFTRNSKGELYLNGGLIDGLVGGTFENLAEFAEILRGTQVEGDYRVYPVSRSVYHELAEGGYLSLLSEEGITVGEPTNGDNLFDATAVSCAVAGSYAALRLDTKTLAASATQGGKLTSALDYKEIKRLRKYTVQKDAYACVYLGEGKPVKDVQINSDYTYAFPAQEPLPDNLITKFSCIYGAIDGESDWSYFEADGAGRYFAGSEKIEKTLGEFKPAENTQYSYAAAALDPGEICPVVCEEKMIAVCISKAEYTDEQIKMLVNDGTVPFTAEKIAFKMDELLYLPGLADALKGKEDRIVAKLISKRKTRDVALTFAPLTDVQKKILLAGGFIGFYKKKKK